VETMLVDTKPTVAKKASPTIEYLIEQKEKANGTKKRKIFDYDDEW
jgi:hypothetical protein